MPALQIPTPGAGLPCCIQNGKGKVKGRGQKAEGGPPRGFTAAFLHAAPSPQAPTSQAQRQRTTEEVGGKGGLPGGPTVGCRGAEPRPHPGALIVGTGTQIQGCIRWSGLPAWGQRLSPSLFLWPGTFPSLCRGALPWARARPTTHITQATNALDREASQTLLKPAAPIGEPLPTSLFSVASPLTGM